MPTTRATRRRDWLVWGGVVLGLVGLVAATGGLADAAGGRRTAAAEQQVQLSRWTFASTTPNSPTAPPTGTKPTRSSGSG